MKMICTICFFFFLLESLYISQEKNNVSDPFIYLILQAHHLRCLNDFIEAQMTYYAQCQQYMADLQRQLGRFVHQSFL